MSNSVERIELLINRELDGELTADEKLELDRALIRSPEHRRLLEQAKQVEGLCSAAIESVSCASSDSAVEQPVIPAVGSHSTRGWWLLPAALAACLTFLVLSDVLGPIAPNAELKVVEGGPARTIQPSNSGDRPPSREPIDGEALGIQRVSALDQTTDRRFDRRIYGVPVDEGNLLLIEVKRMRSYRYPRKNARYQLVGEEL